jgi:hypothetical protein
MTLLVIVLLTIHYIEAIDEYGETHQSNLQKVEQEPEINKPAAPFEVSRKAENHYTEINK